jgi:ribonuclease P/MRP protein subunit RPP1
MFYDLNLRSRSTREKDRQQLLKRMWELGWDCIAWNTNTSGRLNPNLIKPVKIVSLDIMQKRDALYLRSLVSSASSNKIINNKPSTSNIAGFKIGNDDEIRQFNRLTIAIDDVIDVQYLTAGNETLKQFDIIAVCPGNMKVFAYLCKTAEIDIISLDFTHKIPFSFNKKLLDEAVRRGIYFEISYSNILTTPAIRREVINGTRVLIEYLKGKNIIFSSGAELLSQVRGPIDVINIGESLKINKQLSTKSISENTSMILKHAAARKLRFLPVEILLRDEFYKKWPEYEMKFRQGLEDDIDNKNEQSKNKKRNHDDEEEGDDDDDDDISDLDDQDIEDKESEDEIITKSNLKKQKKNKGLDGDLILF